MSEFSKLIPLNLFEKVEQNAAKEVIEVLQESKQVRIERIVSHGHASSEGFWYDQSENEWVLVLAGAGELELLDPAEIVKLSPGDYLYIPAHRRHRVKSTAEDEPTVWLAIFFRE